MLSVINVEQVMSSTEVVVAPHGEIFCSRDKQMHIQVPSPPRLAFLLFFVSSHSFFFFNLLVRLAAQASHSDCFALPKRRVLRYRLHCTDITSPQVAKSLERHIV